MVEFRGITKRFPGVVALDGVSFAAAQGEVVAVIGENGAGKSTLMKILGGVDQPDSGEILLGGDRVVFRDPGDALARGIRVVYQELSVLDNLDVAGNIFLGTERRVWAALLDRREMARLSDSILARVGLACRHDTPTSSLSLAERQLVEIARALSTEVKVLVLDEPTSSLTLDETDRLLKLVGELSRDGVTTLFVSHRLDEVKRVADRVVVLRDGRLVGELFRDRVTTEAMVRLMVARDLDRSTRPVSCPKGSPRLRLHGVRTVRYPESAVTMEVAGGQVLGMAGLVGSGRSELARAVCGMDPLQGGRVEVDGRVLHGKGVRESIEASMYLVPEDRRGTGLTVEMNVTENVTLPNLAAFATCGWVNMRRERAAAQSAVEGQKVKAASLDVSVSTLSGGNQQKVVLARWLSLAPKVMVFDEPTRGIDVGSKAEIYAQMRRLASQGVAIWMVTSDMEELFAVSDRIAVMCEGRIAGEMAAEEATQEAVMKLAVGA